MKLLIGIVLLAFGCFLDFSFFGLGTILRFICGIIGALFLVGGSKYGFGYVVTLISGLLLYTFMIRAGSLHIIGDLYVNGMFKYALRVWGAILFIMGWISTKEN